jgi:hypothetical protein
MHTTQENHIEIRIALALWREKDDSSSGRIRSRWRWVFKAARRANRIGLVDSFCTSAQGDPATGYRHSSARLFALTTHPDANSRGETIARVRPFGPFSLQVLTTQTRAISSLGESKRVVRAGASCSNRKLRFSSNPSETPQPWRS